MSSEAAVRGVADLFDLVAATYDSVDVDYFQLIAADLLRHMEPVAGESWLDVGCGRGAVLLPAARGIGPTGQIVGVDVAARMLELLGKQVEVEGLTNVDLRLGDAQDLPVATEQFDTISCALVIFFVPEPLRALQSMHNALRSGGRIGVTTFGAADPRWAGVDAVLKPHWPPRSIVETAPDEPPPPFTSDAGMEEIVSSAGFVDVRTVRGEVLVRFANPQKWLDFSWSHGQRAMWLSVPEAEHDQLREHLTRALQEIAEPDGSIAYAQEIRHTLARRA